MDSSYIFSLEEDLRSTLRQFNDVLVADKKDLERYQGAAYRNTKTAERWENKLTAYMDALNDFEFLLKRAITVDHERSTYVHRISKLKDDNKRLHKYLHILSVTKEIDIAEQVKFKTEMKINQLCKQAEEELRNEIELTHQTNATSNKVLERRLKQWG